MQQELLTLRLWPRRRASVVEQSRDLVGVGDGRNDAKLCRRSGDRRWCADGEAAPKCGPAGQCIVEAAHSC